jgi:hypothetical protein
MSASFQTDRAVLRQLFDQSFPMTAWRILQAWINYHRSDIHRPSPLRLFSADIRAFPLLIDCLRLFNRIWRRSRLVYPSIDYSPSIYLLLTTRTGDDLMIMTPVAVGGHDWWNRIWIRCAVRRMNIRRR